MLSSGKKFALCATKEINILTLMLYEKIILNETKNHIPPLFKLNGPSVSIVLYFIMKKREKKVYL